MVKLKKDITFIYMDKAEYQSYYPIYEEAKKRGYKVKLTDNKFEKCEIGFYCQHTNFPKYSKFSIVMLHDIIQGYGNWPNIWKYEPWDKYDIGILPGHQWTKNWKESSDHPFAHPKKGIYEIGWTKADIVNNSDFFKNKENLYKELGLDSEKKTVLYAPAWENDNKQDEFVREMLSLDVNIIIKQAPWDCKRYPYICSNIKEMNSLHKNIKRVKIIDPSINILDTISICDILVSEESSTLCEATILGKVAVSVVDWLIPDVLPSRLTCSTHPFTVKTNKTNLAYTVNKIFNNYEKYEKISEDYCKDNFSNIGQSSIIIMDIIDAVIDDMEIPHKKIDSHKKIKKISKKEIEKRKIREIKDYILEKYFYRYPFLKRLHEFYIQMKYK
jgi:hypothetical protein